MEASGPYHAGIVVDDFDAARASLSARSGQVWTKPVETDVRLQSPDGERVVRIKVCFSASAPHLELIESVPGTIWETSTSGVHHLGYWSDDVAADCETLVASGATIETWSEVGGLRVFAYCKAADGPRIELVHRSFERVLQGWIADVSG